jgi:hypothetical protein
MSITVTIPPLDVRFTATTRFGNTASTRLLVGLAPWVEGRRVPLGFKGVIIREGRVRYLYGSSLQEEL